MSTEDKLIARFLHLPVDFRYDELVRLLAIFGFKEDDRGATSGSRRAFFHDESGLTIHIHKPHPDRGLKKYMLKQIREFLIENNLLIQ